MVLQPPYINLSHKFQGNPAYELQFRAALPITHIHYTKFFIVITVPILMVFLSFSEQEGPYLPEYEHDNGHREFLKKRENTKIFVKMGTTKR